MVGFAATGPFRAGEGYRDIVEHSVYVDRAARRRGIGRALLSLLIAEARAAGRRHMVGGISADQEASRALHARLGFVERGKLPGIGRKAGKQLDLVLMARAL